MNKPQAAQLIKNTFTRPFDRGRFRTFALNLVNRMDESKAFSRNIQYIKDAFKPHVSRFERLGTYTSPDKETVDVLIVHLTQASKLERARTAIRNFVADHLKDRDEKDAALVAFVSPAEAQWRFSYVKMEYATVKKESGKVGVETRLTPARRFSYLVGEGESCHTAQTRFLGLLQDTDTDPTLAQMEEAFSVEAVTKEFFGKYAERFDDIHAALDKMVAKDKTLRNEFKEKNVSTVDFAKKLLGQVVFLYFLQKKGWLGVEKGKDWGTGPRDFLRRMARGEYGKYNNFFNDILEPLFYDTLATDRGHEAWCARFKCRIPFLNGGLFEPLNDYDWKKTDILIPNKLFTNDEFVEEGITGTGVLDVFDRYNFTVNEAEPLEKEVAIDPEMLGKVFENLIEENRRKGLGAFYTPREIVHYMCQESLMNYLEAAVNAVPRADVETFVRLGEQISHYAAVDAKYAIKMPKSIEKNAKALDEALKSITVCDPAVGSGAFPVGMMTEIVRASGATATGLTAGAHTVSFSAVSGWTAPGDVATATTNGTTNAFTATYVEESSGPVTIFEDDFEDGDLVGWTQDGAGNWANSTDAPITGSRSLKHNLSGVATTNYVYAQPSYSLSADTTTWRFKLKNGNWDPSSANRFHVFLAASDADFTGSAVDGYAVGINYTGTDDLVKLWRITDGAIGTTVLTSAVDWNAATTMAIEVTRTAAGLWELKTSTAGVFSGMTSAGTASDTTYADTSYFGLYFLCSSTRAGQVWLDDVLIHQGELSGATDSDGDGMPDDYENTYFGGATSGDPDADDDDDGMSNLAEYVAGTHPGQGTSVLAFDPLATNQTATANLIFRWPSVSGRVYAIWRATNAMGPYTQHIGGITADTPTNSVTNAAPTGLGTYFYGLKVEME